MINEFLFEISSIGICFGFLVCLLAFVLSVILGFLLNLIRHF